MAKRFTDTDKWRKPWFRSLNGRAKMVWIYLTDNCDHAGLWPAAFDLLNLDVGFEVVPTDLEKWFGQKVRRFGDKYFVEGFIDFQYGTLNPDNRVHNSVLKLLEKEGVQGPYGSLQGACIAIKDKDKDKAKDKDREGGAGETQDLHAPEFYPALATQAFFAIRKHPAGSPNLSLEFEDQDWEWISSSGLLPIFRQSKDDDFSRKRLAAGLRSAHERFLARTRGVTIPDAHDEVRSPLAVREDRSVEPVSPEEIAERRLKVAKLFGKVTV